MMRLLAVAATAMEIKKGACPQSNCGKTPSSDAEPLIVEPAPSGADHGTISNEAQSMPKTKIIVFQWPAF
nr:hypothetical protein [Dechloromonas sp.]